MDWRGNLWYRFIRSLAKNVVFTLVGGIRVEHAERVPREGAVIFAPVHFSYLDPPLIACSTKRCTTFMAKRELFVGPLGWLIHSLGAFPVDRGSGDIEAIRLALKLLEEKRALLMFPEGTRGDGQTMGTLTQGVTMLAKKSGAKVVPIGINGTQIVWPRGQKKLRRHRIVSVFGEPFTYEDVVASVGQREAKEEFAVRLERELIELCAQAGLKLKTAGSDEIQ